MNALQKMALSRIKKLNEEIQPKHLFPPTEIDRKEDGFTEQKAWEGASQARIKENMEIDKRTNEISRWVDAILSS